MATGGTALLLAGCGGVAQGHAVSPLYDPFRVAGLPAEDGPSGIKDGAPDPEGDVKDTDNGDLDKLATAVGQRRRRLLGAELLRVARRLVHADREPAVVRLRGSVQPRVCGQEPTRMPNAFFCPSKDIMAWDRGVLVPIGQQFFGDVSIAALLGHEYGHAVQHMADIVDDRHPHHRERTAGRLLRGQLHPLGCRGAVATVHAEHR